MNNVPRQPQGSMALLIRRTANPFPERGKRQSGIDQNDSIAPSLALIPILRPESGKNVQNIDRNYFFDTSKPENAAHDRTSFAPHARPPLWHPDKGNSQDGVPQKKAGRHEDSKDLSPVCPSGSNMLKDQANRSNSWRLFSSWGISSAPPGMSLWHVCCFLNLPK